MSVRPLERSGIPAEIDYRNVIRGLHRVPSSAAVPMPVLIEWSVMSCFAGRAEQRGIELSVLLTEVLKRDIEINEALK